MSDEDLERQRSAEAPTLQQQGNARNNTPPNLFIIFKIFSIIKIKVVVSTSSTTHVFIKRPEDEN